MKLSLVLFHLLYIPCAVRSQKDGKVSKTKRTRLSIETEFWNRVEREFLSSMDLGAETANPTPAPSASPTVTASDTPTSAPSGSPTPAPSASPTVTASDTPTSAPSDSPTPAPSASPTVTASDTPTAAPSSGPTASPSASPTVTASDTPTAAPSSGPTASPSASPTVTASDTPTSAPSDSPTPAPTPVPTPVPTAIPTPVPSSSPSFVPSSSPTQSSEPSSAPTTLLCEVIAAVVCVSEDGGSCDFVNPAGEQCLGGNAEELRFIYNADSFCKGNNTQAGYLCNDEVATSRPTSVYIEAFLGGSAGGTPLYEGIVNEGNVFSIFLQDVVDSIDIVISELTDSFTAGSPLQTMTMSTQCRQEDALVLLDTFGGLQLVGFSNEEEGLKSVYTELSIQYLVRNVGIRDMLIASAFKTTPLLEEKQSLLFSGNSILVEPEETRVFSENLFINLNALVGASALDFSIEVNGEDTTTGGECGALDIFTLQVA